MISKSDFKDRLRSLRNERRETQSQVGAAIGIGERHYQKFEAGDNFPNAHWRIILGCLWIISWAAQTSNKYRAKARKPALFWSKNAGFL